MIGNLGDNYLISRDNKLNLLLIFILCKITNIINCIQSYLTLLTWKRQRIGILANTSFVFTMCTKYLVNTNYFQLTWILISTTVPNDNWVCMQFHYRVKFYTKNHQKSSKIITWREFSSDFLILSQMSHMGSIYMEPGCSWI